MPSFDVVLATDPDAMADQAAALLREAIAGADPTDLRPWPVLVPSLAVRDRLRAALAARLGVCAGLDILLPDEFLRRWLPGRLGLAGGGEDGAGILRIARLLDDAGLDLAPAWDERRLALAGRVADALRRAALWAPQQTTAAWSAGTAGAWDAEMPWLPRVWRGLIAADPDADPGHLLAALAEALPAASGLPPLLLAYATNALAPGPIALLATLAQRIDVRVVLLHPSASDLEDQPTTRQAIRAGLPASELHRLLGDWAAEHRRALARFDAAGAAIYAPDPSPAAEPRSLLERLRLDLRLGRPPGEGGAWSLAEDDDSLRFQHAYGVRAEVEALKVRLAPWLAATAAPAPHQVCIATPDPERFAPMLAAVFASEGDGPALPVDLRSVAEDDPPLATAARLLALLPGRWEANAVLDLCAADAIATGHDLSPDDLVRLRRWCEAADLRFGTDRAHREALGLGAWSAASWRRGLQRLALGSWLGDDADALPAWPDADEPLPPVGALDESDTAAFARVAGLLLPLLDAASAWRQPQPAAWWATQVPLLVAHATADSQAIEALAQRFAAWAGTCATLGLGAQPMRAGLVAALLAEWRTGGVGRQSGGIAVGTPAALRGHPWRIVCLLGFDDGAFPRQACSDVDLLTRHPPLNGHDQRAEDRAALLDLIVGCRDHLVVGWSGHDPASGEPTPPATVVGELWEVVRATCATGDDAGLRARLWTDGGIIAAQAAARAVLPWSGSALRAQAEALATTERTAGSALAPGTAARWAAGECERASGPRSHEPSPEPEVALEDLLAFVADPARAWLARRGIRLAGPDEAPSDHERFTVTGGLEAWRLRDAAIAADGGVAAVLADWAARGLIPPGALGAAQARDILADGRALAEASAADWAASPDAPRSLAIDVGDGQRLSATLNRIHPEFGPILRQASKGTARSRQRLWLLGLAWQAAGGGGAGRLWAFERKPQAITLPPDPAALDHLRQLLAWHRRALRTPSPLLPDLCLAWAKAEVLAKAGGMDPIVIGLAAVRHAWAAEPSPFAAVIAQTPSLRRLWPAPADPFEACDAKAMSADIAASGARIWWEPT